MKTKKVKSAGRFGSKYGVKIRKLVIAQDNLLATKWECTSCMKPSLKRVAAGIWECKKCRHKFAGGAFQPY